MGRCLRRLAPARTSRPGSLESATLRSGRRRRLRRTSRRFARAYVSTGTSRERPLRSSTGSLTAEKSAFPVRRESRRELTMGSQCLYGAGANASQRQDEHRRRQAWRDAEDKEREGLLSREARCKLDRVAAEGGIRGCQCHSVVAAIKPSLTERSTERHPASCSRCVRRAHRTSLIEAG